MVLQKLDSGLLTITMNRPDRRNALNPDMTRGLVEAARRAAEDHEVRAVLLKGAGGTFCVGGDVKSMAEGRRRSPSRPRWPICAAAWKSRASCTRCRNRSSRSSTAPRQAQALDRAVLRHPDRQRVLQDHHRLCQVGLSGDYGGTYFLTQMLGAPRRANSI